MFSRKFDTLPIITKVVIVTLISPCGVLRIFLNVGALCLPASVVVPILNFGRFQHRFRRYSTHTVHVILDPIPEARRLG